MRTRLLRRWLTWFLGSVVIAICVAVGAEWFIEVLKQKGYYEDAAADWDRLAAQFEATATSGWVLFPATFLSGLVAGLWLDSIAARRAASADDRRDDAEAADTRKKLALLMDQAARSASVALGAEGGTACEHALPGVESALLTVNKHFDIPVPAVRGRGVGPRQGLTRAAEFLVQVSPLLNGGHLTEARARAAALCQKQQQG